MEELRLTTAPFEKSVLVTGGCGFLGSFLVNQLDEVAAQLGDAEVNFIDITPPRTDFPSLRRSTYHNVSVTDEGALESLIRATCPDTVFHLAALIDCRPRPVAQLDKVNVTGTEVLLALCAKYGVARFVYTSSIEVLFHANRCHGADESTPYPTERSHGYQRTKIEAERRVLAADGGTLATVALRAAHIFGPGDDIFYVKDTPVCFGPGWLPRLGSERGAKMSMVYVENLAAAHLQAAAELRTGEGHEIRGKAFNVGDFDQNIVCLYHEAGGTALPAVTLPFWVLFVLVQGAIILAILCYDLLGIQIMGGKSGLHEAALTAGLPATMNSDRARIVLGYSPPIPRQVAMECCRRWVRGGGGREARPSATDRTGPAAPIRPLVRVRLS